jgi:hypothetical protein
MSYDVHSREGYSTVLTAPSPASSGTSLTVQSGNGALFGNPQNCTVWPAGAQPTTANSEVVRITNISTDTFTITRMQEGSSARSILVGDQISNTITPKVITDIEGLIVAGAPVWQYLGSTSITATPSTASTSYVLVTGVTTGVTVPTGVTKVKVSVSAYLMGNISGATGNVAIYKGATSGALTTLVQDFNINAGEYFKSAVVIDNSPSAGAQYYSLAYKTTNASDGFITYVGSGNSISILVECC